MIQNTWILLRVNGTIYKMMINLLFFVSYRSNKSYLNKNKLFLTVFRTLYTLKGDHTPIICQINVLSQQIRDADPMVQYYWSDLMLTRRLRRRSNIKPTLGQRPTSCLIL